MPRLALRLVPPPAPLPVPPRAPLRAPSRGRTWSSWARTWRTWRLRRRRAWWRSPRESASPEGWMPGSRGSAGGTAWCRPWNCPRMASAGSSWMGSSRRLRTQRRTRCSCGAATWCAASWSAWMTRWWWRPAGLRRPPPPFRSSACSRSRSWRAPPLPRRAPAVCGSATGASWTRRRCAGMASSRRSWNRCRSWRESPPPPRGATWSASPVTRRRANPWRACRSRPGRRTRHAVGATPSRPLRSCAGRVGGPRAPRTCSWNRWIAAPGRSPRRPWPSMVPGSSWPP